MKPVAPDSAEPESVPPEPCPVPDCCSPNVAPWLEGVSEEPVWPLLEPVEVDVPESGDPVVDPDCDPDDVTGCGLWAVSPAGVPVELELAVARSGHIAPVWLEACLQDIKHEIPSASGNATAMVRTDMVVNSSWWAEAVCSQGGGPSPRRRLGRASERRRGYTAGVVSRLPLALALVLSLLATGGCRRKAGPAETYRAFAAAARSRSPDAADAVWGMLSARSREALEARAKEIAARSPAGVIPASGKDLVLGSLALRAARIRSAVVLRESRDAAVVSVEEEGAAGAREVSLVREGGVWRVVLPFDN